MVFDPVTWAPEEIITSEKLNQMAKNDDFLKDRKVSGALRNIAPNGNERTGLRYIKDNLALVSGYKEISPVKQTPNAAQEGSDKTSTVFEREIPFPRDFFHPDFRPVVICSVGIKKVKEITWVLREITNASFTVSIRGVSNVDFDPDMDFFVCYIAMGVKL
jgi:hypothetical protein